MPKENVQGNKPHGKSTDTETPEETRIRRAAEEEKERSSLTDRDVRVIPSDGSELVAACIWTEPGKRVILDRQEARQVRNELDRLLSEGSDE